MRSGGGEGRLAVEHTHRWAVVMNCTSRCSVRAATGWSLAGAVHTVRMLGAVGVALLCTEAFAQFDPARVYQQSAAVLARYPDPAHFTTSYDLSDKRVSMGGLAPDIGRNIAGIENSISYLLEARGVGIGRQSFGRRVHSLWVAAVGVLETTARNAPDVVRTVNAARAAASASPAASDSLSVVTYRPRSTRQVLQMLDPKTGLLQSIEVDWEDSLTPETVLTRPRAAGYLIPAAHSPIAQRLAQADVEMHRLTVAATIEVDTYQVTDKRVGPVNLEGHPAVRVQAESMRRPVRFAAGSFWVPMGQPAANLAAVALEPESASSFVSYDILPVDIKGATLRGGSSSEVPVYRALAPISVPREVFSIRDR